MSYIRYFILKRYLDLVQSGIIVMINIEYTEKPYYKIIFKVHLYPSTLK